MKTEETDREILAKYPPATVVPEILRRYRLAKAKNRTPRRAVLFSSAFATLAVAACMLFAVRAPAPEEVRSKGLEPRLIFHRSAPTGAEILAAHEAVHARDVLQLSYIAAGRSYGAIVSVDSRGVVTTHLAAGALDGDGEIALDRAYELDDAPSFERFFFVTSNAAFEDDAVTGAVAGLASKRDGTPALPEGLAQISYVLEKSP